MPTIREVLSKVKTNGGIPDSIKVRWLGELDHRVYRLPDDADTELLIKDDKIYDIYIKAMNDFFTGDMMAYSESANEFRMAYADMQKGV